jgi:hypothetical protein
LTTREDVAEDGGTTLTAGEDRAEDETRCFGEGFGEGEGRTTLTAGKTGQKKKVPSMRTTAG